MGDSHRIIAVSCFFNAAVGGLFPTTSLRKEGKKSFDIGGIYGILKKTTLNSKEEGISP